MDIKIRMVDMKIRMACEWKNLGRLAIDHFAIRNGFPSDGSPVNPTERVEPLHRHYLNCYFKASTYSEDFTRKGFESNLDNDGHVFPFQEIFMILEDVLKSWNGKLVFPYSEKLELVREPGSFAGNKVIWKGSPNSRHNDCVQRVFSREWEKEGNEAFCDLSQVLRYNRKDVFREWDVDPDHSYQKVKRLSIASTRGSKEEMVRELMMDFLFLLVFIMKDKDLDRIYKLTFRIDDIAAKNCDFGAEMTVKGHVTDIINSWEEHLILRYAEKTGWENAEDVLNAFDQFLEDHGKDGALELMVRKLLEEDFFAHGEKTKYSIDDFCDQFREKIKKTVFLRALRKWFSQKDQKLRANTVGVTRSRKHSDANPQEMENLQVVLDGYVVRKIRSK